MNNGPNHKPLAIAGPLGEDVHVGGVSHFLRLAEETGYRTMFLGPAVSLPDFIEAIHAERPELVGVSYRLTPETGESLLRLFVREVQNRRLDSPSYWFAGTPPTAAVAERLDFFDRVFDGTQRSDEVLSMLRGQSREVTEDRYPQTAVERIAWKHPYPILRHHFGQPTVEATVEGVRRIADARVLDVVSLGTDQDAQANFFHPERQEGRRAGAGGVPVRSEEDFVRLYEATRTGNHPLMRVYSGTDDFLRLADMYVRTIHNAWCAIPLFWFNAMDGRGPWPLEESIRLHQEVMAWYARRGIPVEINEPHHWGMRDAPDSVCVASAYLSALNAKRFGVNDYFAQYMFNSPAELSDAMDLAKMLACAELAESLAGDDFRVYRETRTGLLSYPVGAPEARGHLAASIYVQMALRPHIVHVVSHSEASHAASADDIIESCRIASRSIENSVRGGPSMIADPAVIARKDELVDEAMLICAAIRDIADPGADDPLTDPAALARAVDTGILDAPQLGNNRYALGKIRTMPFDGAIHAVNPDTGRPLTEKQRLDLLTLRVPANIH